MAATMLCVLALNASAAMPDKEHVFGPWTIVANISGMRAARYNGRPIFDPHYFYVAKPNVNSPRFNMSGCRSATESADGSAVVVFSKAVAGIAQCVNRIEMRDDELIARWDFRSEPGPGWGELGFFIPEEFFGGGEPTRFIIGRTNGPKREGALSAEAFPMEQVHRCKTIEVDAETHRLRIDLEGGETPGFHGWMFQDFRDNKGRRGSYRLVLPFRVEKGFDAHIVVRVRIEPKARAARVLP